MDQFELVKHADSDYLAARLLNFSGYPMYKLAAYHTIQALEKYMKAFLFQEKNVFPSTHNLNKLVELCASKKSFFGQEKTKDLINLFNVNEQVSRYGSFANFDPNAKKEEGKFETKAPFTWSDTFIKDIDMLVYNIRGMINFHGNEISDNLLAILQDNKESRFVSEWRLGPIPIKYLLSAHNDYFIIENAD
jgi:HEPN domain-containing protein